MLANIINLVSGCVAFLGGFIVVWGAVSLGIAIRSRRARAARSWRAPSRPSPEGSSSPRRSTSAAPDTS